MTVVGIDLGTTNSLIALWRNGKSEIVPNPLGKPLTPSAVSIDTDGTILVGEAARERLQSHPDRSVAAFKRAMGSSHLFRVADRVFRAEELSSFILRALKADAEVTLGLVATQAVVTVPAYFSEAQRHATVEAGLLAGFEKITLLNEPTAAALAYGLHQKKAETQFLVFDFGGGTFDVSILEMFDGIMEVRATAGDNRLGGADIDEILSKRLLAQLSTADQTSLGQTGHAQLLARVEDAKKQLADHEVVQMEMLVGQGVHHFELDRATVQRDIEPILMRLRTPVERAMSDARISVENLDAVILAGGSTRLPAVRQLVTRMFGRFPETSLDPDQVVAHGAAVQAGLRMRDSALAERVMTDVCPYTLGIETSRQLPNGQLAAGYMAPVLERNTVIPASRSKSFSPVRDFQTRLAVNVYQGEGRRVSDNIALGGFELTLPAGKCNEVSAEVRFTYDVNGLLEVEATPMRHGASTGEPRRLVIRHAQERRTPEQIAIRLAELSALKIHPRDRLEARTLLARAERLHGQTLGAAREHIAHVLTAYEFALESQEEAAIGHARSQVQACLSQVERHVNLDLVDPS
ncbi:Hsp70 family protein [Variovorax sp. RT4R15]|uniref:Hsp70 family protein n=1 Tax=Variovorax sp. RT4R15 TaxID=3443737 RepID=UPI003F457166